MFVLIDKNDRLEIYTYCLGSKHNFSLSVIQPIVSYNKKRGKDIVLFKSDCIIFTGTKTKKVSDNTNEAEGVVNFFRIPGKGKAKATKKLAVEEANVSNGS